MNVEIFALCDAATDSHGKLNILGAFDTIFAKRMPSIHPQCAVAVRMRMDRMEGKDHNIAVRIVDEDGATLVPPLHGQINVNFGTADHTAAVNVILNIQQLQLKHFGGASINLEVDGKELSTLPLNIKQI